MKNVNELRERIRQEKVRIDELNLKNQNTYKIEYVENDIYGTDDIKLTVEADCAEDALTEAELHAFNENIDLEKYRILVYQWIPETLSHDGDWQLVNYDQMNEIEQLKQLEGKTITNIKTSVKHNDRLKTITIEFDDLTDITFRIDNELDAGSFIDILKLPF